MDRAERVAMSRCFARALRHRAVQSGLEPDPAGWVEIDRFVERWSRKGGPRRLADVEEVVAASGRFELSDDHRRVRARYGHSFPVELGLSPQQPPAQLFYATHRAAWAGIAAMGLRPGRRQYVHLAHDLGSAESAALRLTNGPIVIVVDAAALYAQGARLLRANDEVWLTEYVPPEYLQLHPDSIRVVEVAPVPVPPPRTEEQLAAATADWLQAQPEGTELAWGGDTEFIGGRWVTGPECELWVEELGRDVGLSWVWMVTTPEVEAAEVQRGGHPAGPMHVIVSPECVVEDAMGDQCPAWSAEGISTALRDWSRAHGVDHVSFRFDPDHPDSAFVVSLLEAIEQDREEAQHEEGF